MLTQQTGSDCSPASSSPCPLTLPLTLITRHVSTESKPNEQSEDQQVNQAKSGSIRMALIFPPVSIIVMICRR